jgi:spore coat polysaccharide biosynthesis predicted glycosyltransferase SpsG
MILDPAVASASRRLRQAPRIENRVPRLLIALGGGAHVYALASRLCSAIGRRNPDIDITVARGLHGRRVPPRLTHGRWIDAPDGLAGSLAESDAAILAGGVTLYEACALGVPALALALTGSQHRTVRAIARLGAAMDLGCAPLSGATLGFAAEAVAGLMASDAARASMGRAGRQLVDGQGVHRVAARLALLQRGGAHAA